MGNGSSGIFVHAADPVKTRYVAMWSGAARMDEEQQISAWTLKNSGALFLRHYLCQRGDVSLIVSLKEVEGSLILV